MKVNKVVIAGVDHTCDIKELEQLKKTYPFIEWGVLLSKHNQGKLRYPNHDWLKEFLDSETGGISAHLCGGYPRDIFEEGAYSYLDSLSKKYSTVQMNYNFLKTQGKWRLFNIVRFLRKCNDIGVNIIFQNHKGNEPMVDMFELWPNFRVLNDASGGNGKLITELPKPKKCYTGYAGGIDPDNVEDIINRLQDMGPKDNVWIDLESGVRDKTNNYFDMDKCKLLLERSAKLIK